MAWWDKHSEIPYQSKNFQKIINFYLFNCPVIFHKRKVANECLNEGYLLKKEVLRTAV